MITNYITDLEDYLSTDHISMKLCPYFSKHDGNSRIGMGLVCHCHLNGQYLQYLLYPLNKTSVAYFGYFVGKYRWASSDEPGNILGKTISNYFVW